MTGARPGSDGAWRGLAVSLTAAGLLLVLLHRALRPLQAPFRDVLFVTGVAGVDWLDHLLLALVAAAGLGAVLARHAAALLQIQLYALAAGLMLTHYRLGTEVRKVDPRLVLGVMEGMVALQACYICLLAHAALWLRRRLLHD